MFEIRSAKNYANLKPLVCPMCTKTYDCSDRIASVLQSIMDNDRKICTALGQTYTRGVIDLNKEEFNRWKWGFLRAGGRYPSQLRSFYVSLMQYNYVMHTPKHTVSCFKKRSSAVSCRYKFPQKAVSDTSVNLGM